MQLEPPATLTVRSPDGKKSARLDVYKTRRVLEEAQSQPTQEKRWERVQEWLAKQLDVSPVDIGESAALQLQTTINELVNVHNARLKKRTESTVSSLLPIPASQETSSAGPTT